LLELVWEGNLILNVEQYRFKRRKKRGRGWVVVLTVLVLATLGILTWRLDWIDRIRGRFQPEQDFQSLSELWKNRLYDEVISRCDKQLEADPLDPTLLAYRGFAYFYKGVSEVTLEERIPYLDEAIVSLRRARLGGAGGWSAEIDYILGKAYYHKGKYYYDLTLEYLKAALSAGYQHEDIYDYLGLAATQLDYLEEGLEYFQKALEINPTDLLLLTMGQTYFQAERYQEAEEYLLRAVNKTEDAAVEIRARFLLGQMYFERQDYFKAEDQYTQILEVDPNSSDAYYYLGEIYSNMNDPVKARAYWRKALVIDPSHYGARLRYYR
jgi:tetratricopeptide (TPR) repeat protein